MSPEKRLFCENILTHLNEENFNMRIKVPQELLDKISNSFVQENTFLCLLGFPNGKEMKIK